MHDVVIRGGRIVDGTGRPAVAGDVAIDSGVISAVGLVDATGREELDAAGCVTSAPARLIGLADRGTLAPGMRADVNVCDPERVSERQPEIVHDFPGGAPRFVQRSTGYRATLLNCQVSVLDGEHTGARAGTVLRRR